MPSYRNKINYKPETGSMYDICLEALQVTILCNL